MTGHSFVYVRADPAKTQLHDDYHQWWGGWVDASKEVIDYYSLPADVENLHISKDLAFDLAMMDAEGRSVTPGEYSEP